MDQDDERSGARLGDVHADAVGIDAPVRHGLSSPRRTSRSARRRDGVCCLVCHYYSPFRASGLPDEPHLRDDRTNGVQQEPFQVATTQWHYRALRATGTRHWNDAPAPRAAARAPKAQTPSAARCARSGRRARKSSLRVMVDTSPLI